MGRIFLTSDTHFFHKNVITFCNRPFSSVDDMNASLVERWNAEVGPEDVVYVLGDFAFGSATKVKSITRCLAGTIHLIIGNHDLQNFKPHRSDLGFASAQEQATIEVKGLGQVKLCHFPYLHGDTDARAKLRYLDKRPIDDGGWLFHGHIHNGAGSWRIAMDRRMVNVGVDVWDYKPVALDRIVNAIQQMGGMK